MREQRPGSNAWCVSVMDPILWRIYTALGGDELRALIPIANPDPFPDILPAWTKIWYQWKRVMIAYVDNRSTDYLSQKLFEKT